MATRPSAVGRVGITQDFKAINDHYGHAAGDAVLVALGETIRATARSSDIAGRLGGDEFALLMPDTDAVTALWVAERLLTRVRGIGVDAADPGATVTASLGVSERTPDDRSLDSLLERADRALYGAKSAGRDRAVASRAV